MLLTRGLRVLRNGRTLGVDTKRQFSSAIIYPRTTSILSNSSNSNLRPGALGTRTAPVILNSIVLSRFQSTKSSSSSKEGLDASSTPIAKEGIQTSSTPPIAQESEFVPDSAFDFDASIFGELEEKVGYLKALGLDYGWGPTACMEWILEHVHIFAGTPWWGSIALTAVAVRLLILKFMIGSSNNAARLQQIKHVSNPLRDAMNQAFKDGDQRTVMMKRAQIKALHEKAGIEHYKSFLPLVQIFTGYGFFRLLRGMAELPVPGFQDGGLLWFTDLSARDPYLILPFMTAGVSYFLMKAGGEAGVMTPQMIKNMAYLAPLATMLCTTTLPAAAQWYFFVAGILSYAQSRAFKSPRIRDVLRMDPLPVRDPNDPGPLQEWSKLGKLLGIVPGTKTPEAEPISKPKIVAPREQVYQKRIVTLDSLAADGKKLHYEAPKPKWRGPVLKSQKSKAEAARGPVTRMIQEKRINGVTEKEYDEMSQIKKLGFATSVKGKKLLDRGRKLVGKQ